MTVIFSHNKKLLDQLTIATLQLDDYKRREQQMLADLGRAGQEIATLARKVGQLQEDNQKLISQRIALLQIINQDVGLPS
ncbi:hypothetical protein [Paenibacillus sp. NPDC101420]|uniref:hypothetical protein n=1 Tax=Paenibacillus sp. NPDC101420 TaxID=3390602 RepID=UPI003CFFEF01